MENIMLVMSLVIGVCNTLISHGTEDKGLSAAYLVLGIVWFALFVLQFVLLIT